MQIYLVRHGRAGRRSEWDGPDLLRPLDDKGRAQGEGLVGVLGAETVTRLVSSPYLRCSQTLAPLAAKWDLEVELDGALAEDNPVEPALELIKAAGDGTVLCSHGDMIPAIIERLVVEGLKIVGREDWRKGATWVLDRPHGRFKRGWALPPPTRAGRATA